MKEITVKDDKEIPENYSGIVFIKNWVYSAKAWVRNGHGHRLDGPAVERLDGHYNMWMQNGKLHRLDGPAVDIGGYASRREYCINNVQYSRIDFLKKTKLVRRQVLKRNTKYKHLTDEQWYEYLNILVIE